MSPGHRRWRPRGDNEGPRPANNPTDFMTALEDIAAAMQANSGGNGPNGGNGGPTNLAAFLKVNPPTFKGTTNPTEADNWFQAMKRALQAQLCRLNMCRKISDVVITWDAFQVEFYKKYFLNSVRAAKELELMQMKQGSMNMAEYTTKFEELCRFSKVCQGAPEGYEEWKYIKYEGGL
ncbi:uncharacterized protein LOC107632758 [Arachis ipaensis]|uniref:uncharacterized protein LOC107632758 n=1 Tax=Arachis ipaensis TaxID=130454 RepID=UPI0007AF2F67|nr:uncharacterized protein LOC107632758 [Arachis ipaensis]